MNALTRFLARPAPASNFYAGWTQELVPVVAIPADDSAEIKLRDNHNAQTVARAICSDEGRDFCKCRAGEPRHVKCHAVARYVKRALRIVAALRQAGALK